MIFRYLPTATYLYLISCQTEPKRSPLRPLLVSQWLVNGSYCGGNNCTSVLDGWNDGIIQRVLANGKGQYTLSDQKRNFQERKKNNCMQPGCNGKCPFVGVANVGKEQVLNGVEEQSLQDEGLSVFSRIGL